MKFQMFSFKLMGYWFKENNFMIKFLKEQYIRFMVWLGTAPPPGFDHLICKERLMTTSESQQKPVFDYRALRLLVGLVAFALPVVAPFISSTPLSSISASYHTEARDVFVGLLFVIGALLFAYNGHKPPEKWVSKGASLAAIIVAIFPTSCDLCESDIISVIHYVAAVVLFSTIAYFCLRPFRERAKEKAQEAKGRAGSLEAEKKAQRRATIYLVCGLIILGCMLGVGATQFTMSVATRKALAITFVAEFIALWAFGIAWIVAGKVIPPLVDKEDMLILSLK